MPETSQATKPLHSASPLTTDTDDDDDDSATESDTEDPVASSSRSQTEAPGKNTDQMAASPSWFAPSPLQTIKGTYHVSPEQVSA